MLLETLLLPLLAVATPPQAKASVACKATVAPPAALAGWTAMRPARAAAAADAAPLLTIGTGVRAALRPTPDVTYPLRPEKPGGADSNGGLFAFEVAQPGRYRVALGAGAWVDVVRAGKAATSVAHGHGPDCTGIRKMVDFDLTPGRYLLQVAGNGSASLPMMVARVAR